MRVGNPLSLPVSLIHHAGFKKGHRRPAGPAAVFILHPDTPVITGKGLQGGTLVYRWNNRSIYDTCFPYISLSSHHFFLIGSGHQLVSFLGTPLYFRFHLPRKTGIG